MWGCEKQWPPGNEHMIRDVGHGVRSRVWAEKIKQGEERMILQVGCKPCELWDVPRTRRTNATIRWGAVYNEVCGNRGIRERDWRKSGTESSLILKFFPEPFPLMNQKMPWCFLGLWLAWTGFIIVANYILDTGCCKVPALTLETKSKIRLIVGSSKST